MKEQANAKKDQHAQAKVEEEGAPKKKGIGAIFNPKALMQGAVFMIAFSTTILTISMAYIIFAPDTWPKPFYLQYQFPAAAAEGEEATGEETSSSSHGETTTSSGEHGSEISLHTVQSPPPTAALEIRAGQGLMVDTGTKIVNLAEPSGRRYMRINVVLEFAPTDLAYYTMGHEERLAYETAFSEEITAMMPIVNDTIISLLSGKTFEGVYTAEGKEHLRQEIIATINSKLPEYRVIFVYFTEFVVQ